MIVLISLDLKVLKEIRVNRVFKVLKEILVSQVQKETKENLARKEILAHRDYRVSLAQMARTAHKAPRVRPTL